MKTNYGKILDTMKPIIDLCEKDILNLEVTFVEDNHSSNTLRKNTLRDRVLGLPTHKYVEKALQGYFDVVFYSHSNDTNFTIGHVFQLDLDHIRISLQKKNVALDFNKPEILQRFSKIIEKNYFEFKDSLSCYNGTGDDYDWIVDFIIRNRGSIHGGRFRL